MVINWYMIGAMMLPNVGGWAGALTMIGEVYSPDGKSWYQLLSKPKWTPPDWLFGPTWVLLYTTMGYASYLIYRDCGGFTDYAYLPLGLYAAQMLLNWFWTPIFFKLHRMGWAFVHMSVLDGVTVACIASFFDINKMAAALLIPYLGWLTFASCLNYSVWRMNIDHKYGVMEEEDPPKQ